MTLTGRVRARIQEAVDSVVHSRFDPGTDPSTLTEPARKAHRYRFEPGCVLAERFTIIGPLGHGGMGEVYEALDSILGEHVAIKTVIKEAYAAPSLDFLKDEVRHARRVTHRNVCRIYDVFEDRSGFRVVSMELLSGRTLSERIRSGGRMTEAEALPLLRDMASGLDAAHQAEVLHRDFKSGNVMICDGKTGPRAVVMDFGLARRVSAASGRASTTGIGGTPHYMAPEQIYGGPITTRADVFSLGVVMYEMLTAKLPFDGMSNRKRPAPPSRLVPGLDPRWEAVILRCLEVEPERRYATAGEAIGELGSAARPGTRSVMRSPAGVFMAATMAMAAALVIGRLWLPRGEPSTEANDLHSRGVAALRDGTYYTAARALQRAVQLRPDFPLAHARLAEVWNELDLPDRARESMLLAIGPGAAGKDLEPTERASVRAIQYTLNRKLPEAIAEHERIVADLSGSEKALALLDLGRAADRNYDVNKAIASYEEAAALSPGLPGAHLKLGILYARLRKRSRSAAEFDQAEARYAAAGNDEGLTEVLFQRGNFAERPEQARELLEKALNRARALEHPHHQIQALLRLSHVAYQSKDAAKAEQQAAEALRLARSTAIGSLEARALLDLASAASTAGLPAKVSQYATEALALARRIPSERLEARALYMLGASNLRAGNREGVVEVEKALAFYQRAGFRKEAADAQGALARYSRDQGDYLGALEIFRNQFQSAKSVPDAESEADALFDIGRVLSMMERYPEALLHLRQSLERWPALGNQLKLGYASMNAGAALARLGEYGEAGKLLDNAAAIAESSGFKPLSASVWRVRSEIELSRLRYRAALEAARRVLPLTKGLVADSAKLICVAHVRSGARAEASRSCPEAAARAAETSDPDAVTEAQLAGIEAALESGAPKIDAGVVNDYARRLERSGRLDSLWRVLLLAARVANSKGETKAAHDYAVRAGEVLRTIEKDWGAAAYDFFARRPDIARMIAVQRKLAMVSQGKR